MGHPVDIALYFWNGDTVQWYFARHGSGSTSEQAETQILREIKSPKQISNPTWDSEHGKHFGSNDRSHTLSGFLQTLSCETLRSFHINLEEHV